MSCSNQPDFCAWTWSTDDGLRRELDEAKVALGDGWLAGGVSLAEGIRRKTAALEGEFDRGRSAGMEGAAKYSNAIGKIESALGISGAIPLKDTVNAVEELVKKTKSVEVSARVAAAEERESCIQDCLAEARDEGTAQRIIERIRARAAGGDR